VVLDAPDVDVLARFYSRLRRWLVSRQDAHGAALDLGEGVGFKVLLDPAGHRFCLYT
jgi:hypothetical protein